MSDDEGELDERLEVINKVRNPEQVVNNKQ